MFPEHKIGKVWESTPFELADKLFLKLVTNINNILVHLKGDSISLLSFTSEQYTYIPNGWKCGEQSPNKFEAREIQRGQIIQYS